MGGTTYRFCSEGCRTRFAADPERYVAADPLSRGTPAGDHVREGVKYTCPMHPEIVRDEPGTCPICGMALEPMGPSAAGAEPNPELIDFSRRLKGAAALPLPLLALAMSPHLGLPVQDWLGARRSEIVELLLATPVVLWCGLPFFERGVASVANRSPNMWTLIALGVPVAAGVLYPAFGVLLSPEIAALAMSLSCVSVVANALRLGRRQARAATTVRGPLERPGIASFS